MDLPDDPSKARLDPEADANDLEAFVGYNLKRAYMTVRADFQRALGKDGFSPRVFSALSLIVATPGISQSELALKLGIERSGLVAITDELDRRGLARRAPVPRDRRVQALMPTPEGKATYDRTRKMVTASEASILADLSPQEIKVLIGLLRRIRSQQA